MLAVEEYPKALVALAVHMVVEVVAHLVLVVMVAHMAVEVVAHLVTLEVPVALTVVTGAAHTLPVVTVALFSAMMCLA